MANFLDSSSKAVIPSWNFPCKSRAFSVTGEASTWVRTVLRVSRTFLLNSWKPSAKVEFVTCLSCKRIYLFFFFFEIFAKIIWSRSVFGGATTPYLVVELMLNLFHLFDEVLSLILDQINEFICRRKVFQSEHFRDVVPQFLCFFCCLGYIIFERGDGVFLCCLRNQNLIRLNFYYLIVSSFN